MLPTPSKKIASQMIESLQAGTSPRVGLDCITVGRLKENKAMERVLEAIRMGSPRFRFVVGEYGAGKSFFMNMIRTAAIKQKFVCMDVTMDEEKYLTGTGKQGKALYGKLVESLSFHGKSGGKGLETMLQRWILAVQESVAKEKELALDDPALTVAVEEKIAELGKSLTLYTFGAAFATVISKYWTAIKTGDENLKDAALNWLQARTLTLPEAKKTLKVDRIIKDDNWFEAIKMFSIFAKLAGYNGLLVFLDECNVIYTSCNPQTRKKNYQMLFSMYNELTSNDTDEGDLPLGVFAMASPVFIEDPRKGLFSIDAFRSRLDDAGGGRGSAISGTIIRLAPMTDEEFYLLLERLCVVYEQCFDDFKCNLSQQQLLSFLQAMLDRIGANNHLTPREVTRTFVGTLDELEQKTCETFEEAMRARIAEIKKSEDSEDETETAAEDEDDAYADFEI